MLQKILRLGIPESQSCFMTARTEACLSYCICDVESNFSTSTNAVQLLWNPSHRVKGRRPLYFKRTLRSKSLPPRHKLCAANHSNVAVQEDDHKKLWEESKQSISALDFTAEEADLMLKKAFGWVHSPYWGEERRRTLPEYDSMIEMLDYLKSLSLSDDDLHKILKKFPEVLGCDLDGELKANIDTLEREWGIKGSSLRNLLLRNPKVLGYNVDCKGDCMAHCTRCWVRF
ncbi:hypothetical protein AXF42_Ash016802 [Apostasia shenzhenica]|uniref:Mitochondrial transcription termination factor family protein n=1 Tax=Apostasia shenzhenica TaxID=1088818 RepID=A0A2I0BAH7_9ASPA|nr:hypothetical protein AXF42_Ash016802 [Apostasia shenzhenica]